MRAPRATRLRLAPPVEPALDLADVQGNILRGYRVEATAYAFLTVVDAPLARDWLGELADQVTSAERRPEEVAVNVGLTASGLARLGVPARRLAWLPQAFLEGMARRAGGLGDPVDDAGDPAGWHPPFDADGLLHLVLTLAGARSAVDARLEDLEDGLWQCGVMLSGTIRAAQLPGEIEHFGFRDGISQPRIDGVHEPDGCVGAGRQRRGRWEPLRLGEFILGMPGEDGAVVDPLPALTRGGSYLVIRKLEQDVAAFRGLVARAAEQSGLAPDLVAAKLVGRWPDGTPLTLHQDGPDPDWESSRHDGFDYSADPDGARCPIGSHVRRANPRGSLEFDGALEARHRMLRRGMPYGPLYDDDPTAERGLVFACYQADIAGQFEFVQSQWLADGNVFALGADRDPVVVEPAGSGVMRFEGCEVDGEPVAPVFVDAMARCVTSRGGEYFLVPSISGLRWLSQLPAAVLRPEDAP